MFRDVLVHVDGSEAGRQRVRFAVELAARVGARLSGLHVTPPVDVPPLYKPSHITEVATNISSALASDARAAAVLFSEETKQLADASWSAMAGDIAPGISDQARYADLVILGQYEWQGPAERHPLPIAHSVVLHCGCPVLVVPASVKPAALARVAVAWDGSREAVRAVHDALPLLHLSRSIQIVTMITPPLWTMKAMRQASQHTWQDMGSKSEPTFFMSGRRRNTPRSESGSRMGTMTS